MVNILDLPQTNSFGGFPPSPQEQITMMFKILNNLDPVFADLEKLHERFPLEGGYVGEALASVLRNSPMMQAKNPGYDLADGTEVKTATLNLQSHGSMTVQFSSLKGKVEKGAERFMFIVNNPLKRRIEVFTFSVASLKKEFPKALNSGTMGVIYSKKTSRFEKLENGADRMQVVDENGLRDVF